MKLTWHAEKRKIAELNPAVYNPRKLTEKQAKDLGVSLERFGLAEPIVINRNNTIIGGHQRIKVLKAQGVSEVDVMVPDRLLTDEEEKELNLRLNRNVGEWDLDLLSNFEVDFLKDIGFTTAELDSMLWLREDDFDAESEYSKIKTDIIKGDVFALGDHRLMCGDTTAFADFEKLLGGGTREINFHRSAVQCKLSICRRRQLRRW